MHSLINEFSERRIPQWRDNLYTQGGDDSHFTMAGPLQYIESSQSLEKELQPLDQCLQWNELQC